MALARFNIVVTTDSSNGISKSGSIPWYNSQIGTFTWELTVGHRKNAVIMGRKMFENLLECTPLKGRQNVIISKTWLQQDHPELIICPSLLEALFTLGSQKNRYDEIFIMGGCSIFEQTVRDYLYLCDRVYINRLKINYSCTDFFPFDKISDFEKLQKTYKTREFLRDVYLPKITHQEYNYIQVVQDVLDRGEQRCDSSGINTISKFGCKMEFDISERIPILTTRNIRYTDAIWDLLRIIKGNTNNAELKNKGIDLYCNMTSEQNLERKNISLKEGDMGPEVAFQMKHWGEEYGDCHSEYAGFDQLENLINNLRTEPFSRKHVVVLYNPNDASVCTPCQVCVQFYVSADKRHLDCQIYQRSCDLFYFAPHNIAVYSMLTYVIAHLSGYLPRRFIYVLGDAHVYSANIDAAKRQIGRTPKPFATLRFRDGDRLFDLKSFEFENFEIDNYTSWPNISSRQVV